MISTSTNDKKPAMKAKGVNENFFSVGHSGGTEARLPIDDDAENRDDAWRNIKPNQNVDALSKEMYKKRKYEEFRERQAKSANRRGGNSRKYQAAKKPKVTPEMEEKQRI